MGEQVADGDRLLARARKQRQEVLHLLVEIEAPLVHQDHRHGRRGNHLGQTCQVVDRRRFDCPCILVVGKATEGIEVHEGPSIPHGQNAAGEGALLDELLEHAVHLLHSPRPETRILRGGGAQGHGAPRDLDSLTVGVILGESHRQSAPNINLAEEC